MFAELRKGDLKIQAQMTVWKVNMSTTSVPDCVVFMYIDIVNQFHSKNNINILNSYWGILIVLPYYW